MASLWVTCKQTTWRGLLELHSKKWGAEMQICWEPCADRWKMCTCRRGYRNSNLIPTIACKFST